MLNLPEMPSPTLSAYSVPPTRHLRNVHRTGTVSDGISGCGMAKSKLALYQQKREFTKTGEPSGAVKIAPADYPRFVIQKHAATRLHYDLRLEVGGVFKSWAVTRVPRSIQRRSGSQWKPRTIRSITATLKEQFLKESTGAAQSCCGIGAYGPRTAIRKKLCGRASCVSHYSGKSSREVLCWCDCAVTGSAASAATHELAPNQAP